MRGRRRRWVVVGGWVISEGWRVCRVGRGHKYKKELGIYTDLNILYKPNFNQSIIRSCFHFIVYPYHLQ